MNYSLLTISSGRDEHLANLVAGASLMAHRPHELVIVFMNQPEHPALEADFPIHTFDIAGERLPLASARNAAAAHASRETLLFLDVDCVPSPQFAAQMLEDLKEFRGLVMGEPWYLPAGTRPFDSVGWQSTAMAHNGRSQLTEGRQESYNAFWSLCFAITKTDFNRIGGFDETLAGYGGEDTDFAWAAEKAGVPFSLSAARAFHQHHSSYQPPLNHFADIVSNARLMHHKWNRWPMEGWLRAFVDMGLVRWNERSLEIVRHPTDAEIKAALTA